VELHYIGPGKTPPPADLVILPGSKSVCADLTWLRNQGWESYLQHHLRYGGRLIGICGGFQMLGTGISDPQGVEGPPGGSAGFGWLDLETELAPDKQLRNVRGRLLIGGEPVHGYEVHAGVSRGAALRRPVIELEHGCDGARSSDDRILGTYVHGLFESVPACATLLRWAGLDEPEQQDYATLREQSIDRLADVCEKHLDLPRILDLLDLLDLAGRPAQ
jgi:adenosylcobyric acid synthase